MQAEDNPMETYLNQEEDSPYKDKDVYNISNNNLENSNYIQNEQEQE